MEPGGLIVAQISRQLEIPRNSVYRICSTLRDHGYLKFFQDTQKIVLTRKLLKIGYRALGKNNISRMARPEMMSLRDAFKETVVLGTLLENEGVVLEELAGHHHFNFRIDRGARFYLHCTAPGKALLAFLDDKERDELIKKIDFTRLNDRTITDPKEFITALEKIRSDGIAFDCGEQIDGCHCVAAPIFDQYDYPIATIWITGPQSRLPISDFERIGASVKEASKSVSIKMGYGE